MIRGLRLHAFHRNIMGNQQYCVYKDHNSKNLCHWQNLNYFRYIIYIGNWFTTMEVYIPGYTCKCTTQQRIKDYHNCILSTLILFVGITASSCTREPHSTLWKKLAGSFLQGANKNRLSPCFVATEHGYDRFIIFYVGRIWCFHKNECLCVP